MPESKLRFPAEWESQSAVLIAWPHADTDWAERLAEVEETYIALVAAITRFQRVLVCVADDDVQAYARARLSSARIDMDRVAFLEVPYDDTWLRDSGPIVLRDGDGFRLLDFRFTGWGGKFDASQDDLLVERLYEAGNFPGSSRQDIEFALEGGAIETDGAGSLLTTWQCLHERHPRCRDGTLVETGRLAGAGSRPLARSRRARGRRHRRPYRYPRPLRRRGCHRVPGLRRSGRFALPGLTAMAAEIAALRTRDGQPYRLFPLPWAKPIVDGGRRLAASYANFLIINGAVLMPAYGDDADAAAAAVLERPSRAAKSCLSPAAR